MELTPESILRYVEAHTKPESPNLQELQRETYAHVMNPQMLSGQVQGKLLEFISRMVSPHRIVEIGTFTGYSGICLARGLAPGGKIITIDINDELRERVEHYVHAEGMDAYFDIRTGNALDILPGIEGQVDLVFIDADKPNYAKYYDLIFDKVRSGGWILADNVLWSGKVLDADKDADTLAIDAFNRKVQADPRVDNMILSIRDGIMIARKIG